MPVSVVDASCQVERLREVVGSDNDNYAVQIMHPPSYLRALLYEGNSETDSCLTPDVVLVYKANIKTSTSSLPLDVRDEINESVESDVDLGGDPLPAPFDENDDIDVSVSERKQYQWPKGELNHLPIKMSDAANILNTSSDAINDCSEALDVWCLLDSGINKESLGAHSASQNRSMNGNSTLNDLTVLDADISSSSLHMKVNKKVKVMLCQHASEEWWSRSYVESQGMCSIASPEMDPQIMKKSHLNISQMPESMMNAVVLCRYNIDGHRVTSDASTSSAFSVNLELKWRQLSVTVPLQEASAKVIIRTAVGRKASVAHDLFRQLCVLHQLFELHFTCWREKVTPEALPNLDSSEDLLNNAVPQDSLQSRIQTLILGGKQALQAQNANRRMSVAPALLGRQSMAPGGLLGRQSMAPASLGRQSIAPGFLGRMSIAPHAMKESSGEESKHVSLNEAIEIATAGTRENSDVTDGLFSLLLECKTFRELTAAWDLTFMDLNDANRPFIRPKNTTRAAKLIKSFVSGQADSAPNFLDIEGSLFPLELVIEMGLEKLTTDYYYIFCESRLVGRDELKAPTLLQAGLGVPREKWLASCGQLLSWLAQVHCALEIVLPLPNSLSGNSVPYIASSALKYFQSETSPVRDVAGLLTPGGSLQEFSINVTTDAVREHTNKKFDWWRMTLTSECPMKKVRSVFLRSHLQPIFPPQLCEDYETLVPAEDKDNAQYYCAEAVTISDKC